MRIRALIPALMFAALAPGAVAGAPGSAAAHAVSLHGVSLRAVSLRRPADMRPLVDTGHVAFAYGDATTKENRIWRRDLKRLKVLETIVESLNGSIALPADVTITFSECGQANAFFDPQKRQITICYEQLTELRRLFSDGARSQQELSDAVVGATVFIFYHELGHALIALLDLPVTGREEDAVDQLSTLILADGTNEREQAALDGARFFYLASVAQTDKNSVAAFADEHALDQQRYYNIICLLYGHDEARYKFLVDEGTLPTDRSSTCGAEFARIKRSWRKLLAPYLKQSAPALEEKAK